MSSKKKQRRSERRRTRISSAAEVVKPANAQANPPPVGQTLAEAVALHKQGKLAEAASKYEVVLQADRNNFDALHLLGVVHYQQGQWTEAVTLISKALARNGNVANAHYNLGNAFKALHRLEDAVASYRRALKIQPNHTGALVNLGNALTEQSHHEEAIACLRRAVEIDPNLAQAHNSMGNALKLLKRPEDAIASYRDAIKVRPDYAEAHYNLGNALRDLKRYEEAVESLRRALEIEPDHRHALGALIYAERRICAWDDFDERARELAERVRGTDAIVSPFVFLSYSADPQDQLRCAQSSAREVRRRIGATITPLFQPGRQEADRIRVGYLSADFHRHATAYLMAELFELHDRERFEILAFSYGPDDGSAMRGRLEQAFDRFIDVRQRSDEEVARQIADLSVDILVDLKGYTQDCRPGILAYRPAPIQVNYLGFPGTMGADFIDYILVDPFVVPVDQQPFFSEKLVQLPDCYQVNDSTREIAEHTPSRAECGLPSDRFVFCCFNNNYKITPDVFEVWMRLLKAVPGSALWLLRDTEAAERNLRRAAQARGVEPQRLVFAPRRKLPEHLARHRVADLFLDTLPYNAHTTASDALWAGLPVLTCVGRSFAGRVAGSLLYAVRLPELVTNSLEDYEALAKKLAKEPELLQSIREKLVGNRATAPLFDTDRFRRHIEAAYTGMWEIWGRGEGPRTITIEAEPAVTDAAERRSATKTSGASGAGVSKQRKAAEQKQSVRKTLAQAVELHKQSKLSQAAAKYHAVLEVDPDHFDALHLLGVVYSEQGNYEAAVALIQKALKRNPRSPFAHNNLGNALRSLERPEEAIESFRRALKLKADFAEAHNNLAIALMDLKRHEDAVRYYRRALEIRPEYAEAHYNLANALRSLGSDKEAIVHYRRALQIKPDYADAHSNLGNALRDLKQYEEAVTCYRRALEIGPASAEVHNNLGSALRSMGRQKGAISSFQRAVEVRPDCAEAYYNLGLALSDLGQYDEAVASYRHAIAIRPDLPGALGTLALIQRRLCDWTEYTNTEYKLAQTLSSETGLVASPFAYLVFSGEAEEQLKCAQRFSQSYTGRGHKRLCEDSCKVDSRVRLGYLSADFREHPLAFLIAELFERHDRERFEVFAFSFGRNDGSVMRRRLERAFDHFIDVSQLSDAEVASRMAELGIHIAIDLMGYTMASRPEILAYRPAPVQVNYLGFPGTMGADFIDYILVDPFVVPADQQPFFAEKLVHLPDCFQVNDSQCEIAEDTPTRAECGLPENGFVFCCFNNPYKITPVVFDVWMRLLEAVPGSVLWLFVDNEIAEKNLRREAHVRNVDVDRLISAPRRKYTEYLARYRVADLFLDTLPYNAGTTASDALWAGLPVLTCAGRTFAGRMAGSLLHAVGLPELVTESLEAYEALALKLATEPELLDSIREKLARNRETAPLFDTDRFRSHIEAAYTRMWEIKERGEGPRAIVIEDVPAAADGNERRLITKTSGASGSGLSQRRKGNEQTQSAQKTLAEALALHKRGKLSQAAAKYQAALKADANHFQVLHYLGVLRSQQGRKQEAVDLIRKALQQNPDSAEAYYNLGLALHALRQYEEAIDSYRHAVMLKTDYAEAHNNLGNALKDLKQFDEAVDSYQRALEIRPSNAGTYNNLGVALSSMQQYGEAVASYRRALELKPDYVEAHNNLGNALKELNQIDEAVACYRRALDIRPDYASAHNNLGIALKHLTRYDEAVSSYRQALRIRPEYAEAHHNLGNMMMEQKRYEEAATSYRLVLAQNPDHVKAFSSLAHAQRHLCDWSQVSDMERRLLDEVGQGRAGISPLSFLSVSDDPQAQLRCAQLYVREHFDLRVAPRYRPELLAEHGRIRLGYLSADLREHAVAFLMAGLFELHEREKFEVFAFSYGPADGSAMRHRLEQAFDHFIDVRRMSDDEVAERIAELGIHITIDLTGHTGEKRTGILARRPAPVQVNYLGFPGTLGADFIDYILVDPFVVPADQQPFFAEKLVHLPDCFQVNDSEREIAEDTPTRAGCGLPEHGFVFCCFNNSYKITPAVFDVWMRLLVSVPGSVLWLVSPGEAAQANLCHEAQARGVSAERLVFASRTQYAAYLAGYRVADLFLDTLLYNAGTTASDALWAGLPVLTCAGRTFASRMAGSLLHAVELPELVTNNLEEYEALALKLAREPKLLKSIRETLTRNKGTAPLFNTDRFRRHVEAAYAQMWELWERGEGPRAIKIEAEPAEGDDSERRSTTKTSATYGSGVSEQRKAGEPMTAVRAKQHVSQNLAKAAALHEQGKLSEAEAVCKEILQVVSNHFDALHLLGVVRAKQGDYEGAVTALEMAKTLNPGVLGVYSNLGSAYGQLNRPQEAAESYRHVITRQPESAEAYNKLGIALNQMERNEEAVGSFQRAIEIQPDFAEANYNLACVLKNLKRFEEATGYCKRALELAPDYAQAHYALGNLLMKMKRPVDAEVSFRRAIEIEPTRADAHNNLGIAMAALERNEDAIALYHRAIELRPRYADAYYNLGNALREVNRTEEAIANFRRAIEIRREFAQAYNNLGSALRAMKRYDEAIASYREALRIRPDYVESQHNIGNIMMEQKRYEAATASYRLVLAQNPDYVKALSKLAHAQRHMCDWSQVADTERRLRDEVGQGHAGISPLSFLSVSDDPEAQLHCAQLNMREHFDHRMAPRYRSELRAERGRIRLSYLSADLREHAVAFLMAGLFELHDREKFEVFAFSFGREDSSAMRHRLEQAFDHFIEVGGRSDDEVADRMAELGIHIAIDLTGHTAEARTGILARRPAPVVVNYLGFPGTMGADFIDYILVDPFVVPADQQPFFAEKLVHLPDCFQVNDSKREIAEDTPTRADCGLPEDGFVFCCFNNTYKITPAVFDVWMRLLGSVPGSVLWLVRPGEVAQANLRREAQARGVSAERLVFAPRTQYADYLARYRIADLFLDTLPYNAGTTASDALWAGLPVLTCAGRTFASRMAGSLLHAVRLPELVTESLEEYEALALKLAAEPELLHSIREKLVRNRETAPLFDTDRFRRHIEAAYMQMWEIWVNGGPPRAFLQGS